MEADPGFDGHDALIRAPPGGVRPGPKDAWDRFDRVVDRLGTAMEGDSGSAVASALRDLASAMIDIADVIEKRPSREQLREGTPDAQESTR